MAPEFVNKKGVTLIIVVFAMMLLGVLGWTLARMQAADFESNLRTFEPDNALNMAEAGAQYALNILSQNSCIRTVSGAINLNGCTSANSNRDSDCADTSDWLTTPHSLSPGQYNLCLRDPCPACTPVESGDVVIVSRGYIPSQSGSRTMRQIKLAVDIGSLTNALQTQAADPNNTSVGLFNWSAANNFPLVAPVHNPPRIEGAISAGHYEGDGDGILDELGQDYDPPPAPILPDDNNNPKNDIRDFASSYPTITMSYFYPLAPNSRRWPSPDNRPITFNPNPPVTTLTVGGGGSWIRINNAGSFFNNNDDNDGVAIRRADISNWWTGNPGTNWTIITNVTNNPGWSRADVSPNVAWPNNTPIKLVKYFNNNPASGVWYIGKQIAAGEAADTIIDVSNNNVDFDNAYLICEGTIAIKGRRRLRMRITGSAGQTRYPNLATQDGGIFSPDFPGVAGDSENTLRDRRRFQGLIYSQNGEVNFNYLDGTLVYGKQVALDGTARIRYTNGRITSGGFVFEPSTLRWKEE